MGNSKITEAKLGKFKIRYFAIILLVVVIFAALIYELLTNTITCMRIENRIMSCQKIVVSDYTKENFKNGEYIKATYYCTAKNRYFHAIKIDNITINSLGEPSRLIDQTYIDAPFTLKPGATKKFVITAIIDIKTLLSVYRYDFTPENNDKTGNSDADVIKKLVNAIDFVSTYKKTDMFLFTSNYSPTYQVEQ